MDIKKEAKKYLNKYFKSQYINENDDEFKSLVRLLNKAQKAVRNCSIQPVSNAKRTCPYCGSTKIIMFTADLDLCQKCNAQLEGA